MYKVVETDQEIRWNSQVPPLVTLADGHGGRCQIIEDDGCLVILLIQADGSYKPTPWLFREVVEAIKKITW